MLFGLGCERAASKATESSNLKPLAVFYGQYVGTHKGQAPPSEAEFKGYLKSLRQEQLKSFDIADVDSIFMSSRDKKPYVVKYGAVSGPPGPGGMPVIAYEQDGIDGKRYIATSVGAIEEVDSTRFRELVPDAK